MKRFLLVLPLLLISGFFCFAPVQIAYAAPVTGQNTGQGQPAQSNEKLANAEKTETGIVNWETFYGTQFLEVKKTVIEIGRSKILVTQFIQLVKGEIEVNPKTGNPVLFNGDQFVLLDKFENLSSRPVEVPTKSTLSGDDQSLVITESRVADKKTESLLDRTKNNGVFSQASIKLAPTGADGSTALLAMYGYVESKPQQNQQ